MKFGFVGSSYTSRSNAIADEECINLFAETSETAGAQAQRSYLGTPGKKTFIPFDEGSVRGQYWTGTRHFIVAADTLYEVFEDGTASSFGTIESDGKAVSISGSNTQLLIVSSGKAYCFALTADSWKSNNIYTVGDRIIDSDGHMQEANAAAWKASTEYDVGTEIVDSNGNIQVAKAAKWKENTSYAVDAEIVDSNGHIQKAKAAAWEINKAYKLAAQIVDSNGNIQTAGKRIWVANSSYKLGLEIVDSNGNVQKVTTAGTSGTSEPTWTTSTTKEGAKWASATSYSVGTEIIDSNGNIQTVTTSGLSDTSAPSWATSGTTTDGTVVWTAGASGSGILVWTYQESSGGYAGTSGSSEPSWSTSDNTEDGDGTLVWVFTGSSSSAGTSGDVYPEFDDAGGSVADGDGTLVWEDQGATTIAGKSGTTSPSFKTSGLTADNKTLVWSYKASAEGYAGQSGDTEPTFDDTGSTTDPVRDGSGTLVWYDKGLRILDVTDQLAGAPVVAKYSDGYFVVIFENSNKFQMSDILDGTTWPALYVNAVSVFPENIVSIEISHREPWIFGSSHAQPYQDTGSDNIFDVIPGALIEMGSAARFGTIMIDNTPFWIGKDKNGSCQAWRASGYTPQRISTHAVEYALSSYSAESISNLVSYSYQEEGHLFWMLYIPGTDCTWVYDVSEGLWHKRGEWHEESATFGPHRSWNHVFAFGKHLVGDWASGNLYEMSLNYWDDDGETIRRVRRAPTITSELNWVFHSALKVYFFNGLGPQPPLLDGDGNSRAPQAMLRWSDDHGETWSNSHLADCGSAGQYKVRTIWRRLGCSRYRVYELTMSDPIPWSIVDAYLDVNT
jgi:hypothetical protein